METALRDTALVTLWDIARGDAQVVRGFIDHYVTMATSAVAGVERALAAEDLAGGERAAHSLKGSSGMMGAHLVQRSCELIEQACAGGDVATARAHLAALQAAHEATLASFRAAREAPDPRT